MSKLIKILAILVLGISSINFSFGQKIHTQDGMLVFESMEHFAKTWNELDQKKVRKRTSFGKEFNGFISTKNYVEAINAKIERILNNDSDSSQKLSIEKELFESIDKIYIVEDEFEEIIINPALASLVNSKGFVKVGRTTYQFTHQGLNAVSRNLKSNNERDPCLNKIWYRTSEKVNKKIGRKHYRLKGIIEVINFNIPLITSKKVTTISKFRKRSFFIYWPHKADNLNTGGSGSGLIRVAPPIGAPFNVPFSIPYSSNSANNARKVKQVIFKDKVDICDDYCLINIKSTHKATKSGTSFSLNMSL